MIDEKKQQYEIGKDLLEALIEKHGIIKGFKLYYKAIITGDIPDATSN